MSTMSMELKYKKPSVLLLSMISDMAGEHTAYVKNAKAKAQTIIEQAQKEEIPNEQLRKLITEAFRKAGLSNRTLLYALPPELKNANMIRKRKTKPKPDPLVKEWRVDVDLVKLRQATEGLINDGYKKGYIVHDNKRVIDVFGEHR